MKDDLISRQAAIDALKELCLHYTPTKSVHHPHIDFVVEELENLPSAKVERKKGKWIPHKLPNGEKSIDKDVCSRCRRRFYQIAETGCIWNYCPHCGADMRGEE